MFAEGAGEDEGFGDDKNGFVSCEASCCSTGKIFWMSKGAELSATFFENAKLPQTAIAGNRQEKITKQIFLYDLKY